jgi:hypothetical protein
LRKLASLLEPEGLLIFSVHDESLSHVKVDGIRFQSESESRVLDVEEYGTTWVTEPYVRDEVAAIGKGWACVRMPRALSDWQDVYVISPAPIANTKPRRVPKGFVEERDLLDDGIRILGWATSVDAPPDRVEIRVEDDVVASTREFLPRPDVAAYLGTESAARSGWGCTVPYAAVRSFRSQIVTISAFSTDGDERILFIGTLDSLYGTVMQARAQDLTRRLGEKQNEVADLSERLAAAEHRGRELDALVVAMKASKFWKAREQWFAMKRAMGWTEER